MERHSPNSVPMGWLENSSSLALVIVGQSFGFEPWGWGLEQQLGCLRWLVAAATENPGAGHREQEHSWLRQIRARGTQRKGCRLGAQLRNPGVEHRAVLPIMAGQS